MGAKPDGLGHRRTASRRDHEDFLCIVDRTNRRNGEGNVLPEEERPELLLDGEWELAPSDR